MLNIAFLIQLQCNYLYWISHLLVLLQTWEWASPSC